MPMTSNISTGTRSSFIVRIAARRSHEALRDRTAQCALAVQFAVQTYKISNRFSRLHGLKRNQLLAFLVIVRRVLCICAPVGGRRNIHSGRAFSLSLCVCDQPARQTHNVLAVGFSARRKTPLLFCLLSSEQFMIMFITIYRDMRRRHCWQQATVHKTRRQASAFAHKFYRPTSHCLTSLPHKPISGCLAKLQDTKL